MLKPCDDNGVAAYPLDGSIIKLRFNTINPWILNRKEYEDLPAITEG
jgi:hypothetical protein